MLTFKQKLSYLADSAIRYFEPKKCPHCGASDCNTVDRKYLVTRLLECQECHLKFRHPYEAVQSNKEFYQKEYKEEDQLTTNLPNKEEIEIIKSPDYVFEPNKNADRFFPLFNHLLNGNKNGSIIDYGSSWGYISHQFKKEGYNVQSFEISEYRAKFGNENLNLNIVSNIDQLEPGADLFFSSHVIEHVPSIQAMVDTAKKLVKKGGYFVCLCPNGSDQYQKLQPESFHAAWGKVHPNFLNEKYFANLFKENDFYLGTTPIRLDEIKAWKSGQVVTNIDVIELILVVKF